MKIKQQKDVWVGTKFNSVRLNPVPMVLSNDSQLARIEGELIVAAAVLVVYREITEVLVIVKHVA
jgi:hypothetical protein